MLYGLVIASRPLLGVLLVILVFVASLAWQFFHLAVQFVGAVERITEAMETREE